MAAGPHRAIEELRLQLAVDRLVADGALPPSTAFDASNGLERELGERGVLGLDLEALRRQARQQRRHAFRQARAACAQREQAVRQCAQAVSRRDSVVRQAGSGRSGTAAAESARRA
jgi:hypothetical protein